MTTLIYLGLVVILWLSVTVKLYRKYWDKGLSASVHFSEAEVDEGQELAVHVAVENRKWLPLPTLKVKFEMDRELVCHERASTSLTDKQYLNEFFTVMPNERVTRIIDLTATKRGFYSIDEWNFVTTDILFKSLFTKSEKNHAWLYVYPAHSRYIGDSQVYCQMKGELICNRMLWEDSMEFKGIRDYTQADPMHKINWKATAKTGGLKVNQFYDTISQRFTIFLNVSQTEILKYYDLIEESIRITRNFLELLVSRGIPVRIISNGVDKLTQQELYIREGAGLSHITECLKQMAKMDIYAKHRDLAEIIWEEVGRGESGSHYMEISVLISAEQTPQLEKAYLRYAGESANASWLIPIRASQKKHYSKIEPSIAEQNSIRREYIAIDELGG